MIQTDRVTHIYYKYLTNVIVEVFRIFEEL